MSDRLCTVCGGNGVVKIPGGISICDHCDGKSWEPAAPSGHCCWTQDGDGSDTWETACGDMFMLNEGTPSRNGMKFCCYCAKPIEEVLAEE